MRSKNKLTGTIAVLLVGVFLFAGCYGSFNLTKKVYTWNGSLGNKFVNSAVMWVLLILPAYEIAGLVDLVVLNTLEFWTGKNPLAMKDGEEETQIVKRDGKDVYITARRNRFDITVEAEGNMSRASSLVYSEEEGAFYIESPALGRAKVSQLDSRDPGTMLMLDAAGNVARVVDLYDY